MLTTVLMASGIDLFRVYQGNILNVFLISFSKMLDLVVKDIGQ